MRLSMRRHSLTAEGGLFHRRPALALLPLAAAAALVALAIVADAGGGRNSASGVRAQLAAATARLPQLRARRIRVPLVRQALRNNCETAALAMLLAAANVHVSQLELQDRLPRSGPLDPVASSTGGLPLWGDPNLGFVGRAAGGGTSGGFGVYQTPIRRLALRYGVTLTDLSRTAPAAVFRQLRQGHPVMVWVGLSEGPYRTWRTPRDRRITVNLGEHTVLLTRLRGRTVELNDPLSGRREGWTRTEFVRLWNRLGRPALALETR